MGVYENLVAEAYDRITLIEYKRNDLSDKSCKYAFLVLFRGEFEMYKVEYNGHGNNYHAVIDGFHEYYGKHHSLNTLNDIQDALLLYAKLDSVKDIQDIYNILDYELTKEENGEATFKIDVQPILDEMGYIIKKYHSHLNKEKANFDNWINELNDYLYKKHGCRIPLENTYNKTVDPLGELKQITIEGTKKHIEFKVVKEYKSDNEYLRRYEADSYLNIDSIINILKNIENDDTEMFEGSCSTFTESGASLHVPIYSSRELDKLKDLSNPSGMISAIYIDRKTKEYKFSISISNNSREIDYHIINDLKDEIRKEVEDYYYKHITIEPYTMKCPHCGKIARKYLTHVYICDSCNQMMTTSDGEKTRQVLEIAEDIESHKYDNNKKLELLGKVNDLYPNDPIVLNKLGVLYSSIDQNKGFKYYKRAVDLDSDYYWANKNIGQYYYNQKNYLKAVEYFNRAIFVLDKNNMTNSQKADIYALYAQSLQLVNKKEYIMAFEMLMIVNRYNSAKAKEKLEAGIGNEYWDNEYQRILRVYSKELSHCEIHETLSLNNHGMTLVDNDLPYMYIKIDNQNKGIAICKYKIIFNDMNTNKLFNISYYNIRYITIQLNEDRMIIGGLAVNKKPMTFEILVNKQDGPVILKILERIKEVWSGRYEKYISNIVEAQKNLSHITSYKFINDYTYLLDRYVVSYDLSSFIIKNKDGEYIDKLTINDISSLLKELEDETVNLYEIESSLINGRANWSQYDYSIDNIKIPFYASLVSATGKYIDRKTKEYKYSIVIGHNYSIAQGTSQYMRYRYNSIDKERVNRLVERDRLIALHQPLVDYILERLSSIDSSLKYSVSHITDNQHELKISIHGGYYFNRGGFVETLKGFVDDTTVINSLECIINSDGMKVTKNYKTIEEFENLEIKRPDILEKVQADYVDKMTRKHKFSIVIYEGDVSSSIFYYIITK